MIKEEFTMTVNGINGTNTNSQYMYETGNAMDSVSRNIQKQIADAQKKLQDLSSDDEITLEEKMKKRQEIQKQIAELNLQLRQHQMELKRQERQNDGSSIEDILGTESKGKGKTDNSDIMSGESMKAIISADYSVKQAEVQGSVATELKGKAGVLESEIKTDKGRGTGTKEKEEELADLQAKAQKATASQMSELSDANKVMEKAEKDDIIKDSEQTEEEIKEETADNTIDYKPVDIRL